MCPNNHAQISNIAVKIGGFFFYSGDLRERGWGGGGDERGRGTG